MTFTEASQLTPFWRTVWNIAFGIYRLGKNGHFDWDNFTFVETPPTASNEKVAI